MASFLKKAMGSNSDAMVNQAVDQAATVAKQKVKSLIGQESNKADPKGSPGVPGGGVAKPKVDPLPNLANQAAKKVEDAELDFSDELNNIADELKQ
ncbi:uncharacterized protein [Paramormyrops kingsleyae]|uniref:uncharacterized protein n=1 Tax=Paramormyrops kingsleyae TaxID=1676925 RepID=UPI003B96EE7D